MLLFRYTGIAELLAHKAWTLDYMALSRKKSADLWLRLSPLPWVGSFWSSRTQIRSSLLYLHLSTVLLISVNGYLISQIKPIKTNQPNKNPEITPNSNNSTLTPHPVYQWTLNCLNIFRNLPLTITCVAITPLKPTIISPMDSCRSLLIGLLASTLIPFIHSHDSSQSDLDKMTDHIIHLPHCQAVPWPHWNPGWSWITLSSLPSQAFMLADSSPHSVPHPDLCMAHSCSSFCSNAAFSGRHYLTTLSKTATSSLTLTPSTHPAPFPGFIFLRISCLLYCLSLPGTVYSPWGQELHLFCSLLYPQVPGTPSVSVQ